MPWSRFLLSIAVLGAMPPPVCGQEHDLAGFAAAEWQGFPQRGLFAVQEQSYPSLVLEPEYSYKWDRGRQSVTFTPFLRLSRHDGRRTHADVRELAWQRVGNGYALRLGISQVFWGVTESQHLVDIVNQTDLVENPDGEDKLGQVMASVTFFRRWGAVDLFVLPGFRERTFAGVKGRLRTPIPVDTSQATFESSAGNAHVDFAARWTKASGDWDIGLTYFYGTNRDPRLLPGLGEAGNAVLIPYYDLIHQTGVDLQSTQGQWLWKVEAIGRAGSGPTFGALTAGFEYTFANVRGSGKDVGLLLEYLYDSRGRATTHAFQDDVFGGMRLALNDTQGTEALIGVVFDRAGRGQFVNLEASRRVGKHWKASVEARAFAGAATDTVLFPLRRDDYVQIGVSWYF